MHKILMVDDEPDLDMLIQQRFRHDIRNKNYLFFFARHGKEALDIMTQHPDIEIVLSDLNMPEMNGLELLKALKNLYPKVKVIILSAYTDPENRSLASEQGAYDFITKPVSFPELEEKLKRLTGSDSPSL